MFGFLNKTKLITNDLKGMAKLMYLDVSKDTWDQENLSKRNLDFTIESIRYMDVYTKRLLTTETGKSLLLAHFDTLVIRTGAYIGEVIKSEIKKDYKWYEFDSVFHYSSILDGIPRAIKEETVLYSKKEDIAILPLTEVAQYMTAKSTYPDLLSYVEEMIKQYL
ncbi:hypothetical protein SRABI96_00875 [Peribacillus sp. Bi96]|uniref:hypothetical protein n=1 Tax=Peribacillus sp. Bi96 TaxID=2884273 RepID=UPI001DD23995|nr:hypothetical protein [Peribacillus sp. Bi96]CAH0157662.1 hypothetical protein SRABI96_00875 [Peribacillus sp. Bi96]